MAEFSLSLISLATVATLHPPQVITMIILLQARQGIAKNLANIVGMTTFRLMVKKAIFGVLLLGPAVQLMLDGLAELGIISGVLGHEGQLLTIGFLV